MLHLIKRIENVIFPVIVPRHIDELSSRNSNMAAETLEMMRELKDRNIVKLNIGKINGIYVK